MNGSFWDYARRARWGSTLWLNLLRAFAAGIVWGLGILVVNLTTGEPSATPWYTVPFVAPFTYLLFVPIFLLTGKIFTTFVGGIGELAVGFFSFVLSLMIAVGDPLVFLLHRQAPHLVPVDRFGFMNFKLVLFVLDTEPAEAVQ